MTVQDPRQCVNCGAREDRGAVLESHDGDLWCARYGDCDRTNYYAELGRELEAGTLDVVA